MRQTAILLVAAIVTLLPTVAAMDADASMERRVDETELGLEASYAAQDDGLVAQGLTELTFGMPFGDAFLPLFFFSTTDQADAVPAEMRTKSFIGMFFAPTVDVLPTTSVDAVESAYDEGGSLAADAAASQDDIEADVSADVADVEVEAPVSQENPASDLAAVDETADLAMPGDEETADEPATASQPEPMLADDVAVAADIVAPDVPTTPDAVAATIAVAGVTGTGLLFFPGGRSILRRVFGVGLFSRIAQEDILNHGRRSELFEYIKQNPGERIENARRALGLSNGSMHYHIKVLNDRNLVRVLRDGGLARLYPAGPKINPQPYVPPQRRKFIDLLSARPGVTQREASQILGISERMASYHIQTLSEQGLVDIQPDGARKRLFLRAGTTGPALQPIAAV